MRKLILQNKMAIGDNFVMTTALRHLQEQYPEQYQIGIMSYYPEVYYNNPHVTVFDNAKDIPIYETNYEEEFKYKKTSGKHFAQGYITYLNKILGTNIQLTDCRPDVYITFEEMDEARTILDSIGSGYNFWIVSPGIKQDVPLKNYSAYRWQCVVDELYWKNIEVIQVGDKTAINPKLKECKSLVGKLNLRQYFALTNLSLGSIGHVSVQMHLAAALNKLCIVIAGGRENISWNCYNNQQYLHSCGSLPCCKHHGCWKTQIFECEYYDKGIAKCMDLIKVSKVVNEVLKYCNV